MEGKIIASASLIAFARTHGSLSMGTCTTKDGKKFKKLCFTSGDNKTYVGFSTKLGELPSQEIVAQKDSLQVVTLDSGNHYLCKAGESSWESIDLGI